MEKVVELEKVSPGVGMISKAEVNKMKNELVLLQSENAFLDSKMAGYRGVQEEVFILKAIVASLELQKTGFLDKIEMLEHGVQKLKNDLNDSALENTDLQECMVGLKDHVRNANEDISWLSSGGMTKVVDKLIVESSFYDANKDLQTICVDYGRREVSEMMNVENNLGLSATDIPLFDPTRFQKIEVAFYAFFLVTTSVVVGVWDRILALSFLNDVYRFLMLFGYGLSCFMVVAWL